jgi:hypothetical protein
MIDECIDITYRVKICLGYKVKIRKGPVTYVGRVVDLDRKFKVLVLQDTTSQVVIYLNRNVTIEILDAKE